MDYDRLRELQEKYEENPRRYFAPLANEYRKGGQPKRAIEICRSQLAQMPGHMSGQIVYGQSLYECGEFEESRQVFERALTLDPENLIALRSLGDMSLQSGDTVQARKWYSRLLDADPKDTTVIALVTEIDDSAEAAPVPTPQEIPGVDADGGDQAIPFITDAEGTPLAAENSPVAADPAPVAENAPPTAAAGTEARAETSAAPEAVAAASPPETDHDAPPVGLERHYPAEASTDTARTDGVPTSAASTEPAPPDLAEPGVFTEGTGAEGLHGGRRDELMGAEGLSGGRQDEPVGAEGLSGHAPPEPLVAEGLTGQTPPQALAGAKSARSDDEDAIDTWTPPPPVSERSESPKEPSEPPKEASEQPKEVRMFSGPGPEPFVNETMAQLYLQQGYRQLALRVYYQLAESRPDDQALKDRIAQIEAADHAAHPEAEVEARREPPVEKPAREPVAPRAPSIESPDTGDSPDTGSSPVDHPLPQQPSRPRESVEAPARDAPAREAAHDAPVREQQRAEQESIAARQPSVREFFATLGRRRPPRSNTSSGGNARPIHSAPADTAPPMRSSAPSASLDVVFAGATVSPSDSRAASRLAGAFSGVSGAARATPPTPPMPTPRVNQRLPQAQESEEDVAKFRAWLDGLTGE